MGRSVAESLAAAGVRVGVLDLNADAAASVVASLPGGASQNHAVIVDVTDEDAVNRAVAEVISTLGPVTLLCNAAGIPDDARPMHEVDLAQWRRILSVDLDGPFLVSRAVIPGMLSQGRGSIVNIASLAGVIATAGGASYTAAKHGLLGLTKRMAVDYGSQGIRVNAVCPGYIATPMNLPFREMLTDVIAATPAGRWAEPEEVAKLVVFLLGDDSPYITGASVMIDGGTSIV